MFNVNYNLKTGLWVSYQGGGDKDENECPEGCGTLTFKEAIPQMFDDTGRPTMKVNLVTKELELINPIIIPKSITVE